MNKMEIFTELVKREPGLMEKPIKELLPMTFIGDAAVTAYRSLIGKLDDLPMSEEQKQKTLRDGQEAGKMLLAIEGRIGELLPSREDMIKKRNEKNTIMIAQNDGKAKGSQKVLPEGMNSRRAYISRNIAEHPKEVEEAIKEAEENEDIPTKTTVLNKIKHKKEMERKERAEPKSIVELQGDELIYNNKLRRLIDLLPSRPPREMTEYGFRENKALALIIIKRLEVFKNGTEEKSNGSRSTGLLARE